MLVVDAATDADLDKIATAVDERGPDGIAVGSAGLAGALARLWPAARSAEVASHTSAGDSASAPAWPQIHVTPHPFFKREGDDLHLDVPVTLGEAYRGEKIRIPTPDGEVTLKIPARTQTGQVIRLRGKGIARKGKEPGDLYVKFLVHVPTVDDPEVAKAIDLLDGKVDAPRGDLRF